MFLQLLLLLLFLMVLSLENFISSPPHAVMAGINPGVPPGHCFVSDIQIFFKVLYYLVLNLLWSNSAWNVGKNSYMTTCQVFWIQYRTVLYDTELLASFPRYILSDSCMYQMMHQAYLCLPSPKVAMMSCWNHHWQEAAMLQKDPTALRVSSFHLNWGIIACWKTCCSCWQTYNLAFLRQF